MGFFMHLLTLTQKQASFLGVRELALFTDHPEVAGVDEAVEVAGNDVDVDLVHSRKKLLH